MSTTKTPTGDNGQGTTPTFRATIMLEIEKIKVGMRFRKKAAEGVESLAKSIERVGLLHPPVVTDDYKLVAGQRRLEAYKSLGRKRIPVRIVNNLRDGLLIAERDENVERKSLTPVESVALKKAIESRLKADAKERQREGGRGKAKVVGTSPKLLPKGKTRDLVAAAAGVSARTLKKTEEILNSGRQDLINDMERTGKVDRAYKKLKVDVPLEMRIQQLDTKLKSLVPKILTIVNALPFQEPVHEPSVKRLASRLVELGKLGERLDSVAVTPKQKPVTTTTGKAPLKSQPSSKEGTWKTH